MPYSIFPRRPDWLPPGQGFILDLMNRFAPREENAIWILIVRDFRKRTWLFWVATSLTDIAAQLVFPVLVNFFMLYLLLMVVCYMAIVLAMTRFWWQGRAKGFAAELFAAPIDNAEVLKAFQAAFLFNTITATALYFIGVCALALSLIRLQQVEGGGIRDFLVSGAAGYLFCLIVARFLFWGNVVRSIYARSIPAFLLILSVLFTAGLSILILLCLSILSKIHCRERYLQEVRAKLYP